MSLYEATVTGSIGGELAIWRSTWDMTSTPAGGNLPAYRLLQALGFDETGPDIPAGDSVFQAFASCATGQCLITSLFARNLYDPLDFYEVPLIDAWGGGQSGGNYMPPFVNAQWRSSRTNLDVRRGHISTWGIQEANVDDNSNVTGADLTTPMDNFAERMSAEVTHTIGLQTYGFRSCILSKERYQVAGTGTDPVTNPARFAYRYYPTETEQRAHAAFNVTWAPMGKVSSRMSRKLGRGR